MKVKIKCKNNWHTRVEKVPRSRCRTKVRQVALDLSPLSSVAATELVTVDWTFGEGLVVIPLTTGWLCGL